MCTGNPERIPLPWSRSCFVCGEANPRGLRARCFVVGESIELPFIVAPEFAGWSGVTHGGLIATVLDEVMTWSAILSSQQPCFAADFKIRILKPLPPGTRSVARARTTDHRRRICDTAAELRDVDGVLYARASGRYMPIPQNQTTHLRDDFVMDARCLDVRSIFGW